MFDEGLFREDLSVYVNIYPVQMSLSKTSSHVKQKMVRSYDLQSTKDLPLIQFVPITRLHIY